MDVDIPEAAGGGAVEYDTLIRVLSFVANVGFGPNIVRMLATSPQIAHDAHLLKALLHGARRPRPNAMLLAEALA